MVLALDGGYLIDVFERDLSSYVVAWGGRVGKVISQQVWLQIQSCTWSGTPFLNSCRRFEEVGGRRRGHGE